ncbi:pyridoxamine 5'-phosphate oxidase family protein [Microlunatus flavus]|uniref:Nitroimidazol reductase NimA, pyridoxamine 5'-phosphate oxidase superfamily n=1 Tax=Microlunatus flavus TaxID=1036181 RepID=A0A1H9J5G2_9ACTN|nr:pyridoxamine 5'-phosphate oxidase family protein [Microlunatus flavus]SEQ82007.1 Nitroimidazol reductase NimA, pyridoxamine 5'-phosphate oxidase superfamily [Microlunatus flavus]
MTTQHAETDLAIRTLSRESCLELLAAEAVGRVGFVGREGVEILPVAYRLGQGPRIFVSTRTWGVVGQLAECGGACTFEVDHHGATSRDGWSVLMHGTLGRLDRAGQVAYAALDRSLEAWPGYRDARPVQFLPRSFSGRSVMRPS